MSDQPQKFNGGEYVDKARDAARDNPDQARSAIDKVQDAVNQRTGGKFESIIDKAGDFVEDKLGLPEETKGEPQDSRTPGPQDSQPTPSEPTEPAPPQEPQSPEPPSQPQEPTRVPAPESGGSPSPESGQSGTPDAGSASTGEGKLPG